MGMVSSGGPLSGVMLLLLVTFTVEVEAQRRGDPAFADQSGQAEIVLLTTDSSERWGLDPEPAAPGELLMIPERAGSRNDAMLNGALIALGALGIFDNVVVHWMLGWHRPGSGQPSACSPFRRACNLIGVD
jgi:hypothetical protein